MKSSSNKSAGWKTCGQVFDVCRIVSQDNAQGLTVYSPLHKTTACTCDTEAGFSAPGYEADSHVLFEKNHRIRLLRDIPRQPCMGCKTGVVVYYNERRDAFISVENETEDYYYPMRDDETLQPGDRVTFFATENPALQAAAQRRQNDDGRQRAVCGRSALLPGPRRGPKSPGRTPRAARRCSNSPWRPTTSAFPGRR